MLALLLVVALMGLGLAGAGELWSRTAQREREKELLFAGNQIRAAIGQYYQRTPGAVKRYPKRLEDLLQDDRYPVVVRYLRRLYVDPMTGTRDWGVIEAPGGGIMGVYSLSGSVPLKRAGFAPENKEFGGAERYTQWRFLFNPEAERAAWAERTMPPR
jgi:type II secretory pathway pseudopilin PulG